MSKSCKRSAASVIAFVALVAGVTAAVRSWRRWRPLIDREPEHAPSDLVIADRVRSALGITEHVLDTPRVHVLVERGVALLHGDVPSAAVEREVVAHVRSVPGVRDVVSNLHIGLLEGDHRPSAEAATRSAAATRLVAAARGAGGGDVTSELSTRVALAAFATALPAPTLRRVRSHLPTDAASWLLPNPDVGPITTVGDLYALVASGDAVPAAHAPWVLARVLGALAALVPDDADEVAAQLPEALGHLWADALIEAGT